MSKQKTQGNIPLSCRYVSGRHQQLNRRWWFDEESIGHRSNSDDSLSSGKEYPAPSVFSSIEADYFTTPGSAPRFNVESMAVDVFVDQYAIDWYLPGKILWYWPASWCLRNQYSCSDNDFVRRRSDSHASSWLDSVKKTNRGLERLRTEVLYPIVKSVFVRRTLG